MTDPTSVDILWPGDDRAGDPFSGFALLRSMVEVETAWLEALVSAGIAPADAADDLAASLRPDDVATVAAAAGASGNPASPLVALLRERLEQRNPSAAQWLHRGLTSQDVVDTALVLQLAATVRRLRADLLGQVTALAELAAEHRDTPTVARTLTQPAVPTTFGMKAAVWLTGVLDALERLDRLRFPAQLGGAAGTRSASVELASGREDPVGVATSLATTTASSLGLDPADPWHTVRTPLLDAADVMLRCTDAWGHLAADVLLLGRPEVGGVEETSGGGSSTMPQKANPVAAVLVRRAALAAPQLLATLHVASSATVDERPDGGWHVEWDALRTLARHTLTASSHTGQVLDGLVVHPDRLADGLADASPGVLAEQESMAGLSGRTPADSYAGTIDLLIDNALDRARRATDRVHPEEDS